MELVPRTYTIREVSEMTGLKPHVLRFWETEFPQLHPAKDAMGSRAYTLADVRLVQRIQYLVYVEKYTLEGARQVMERGGGSSFAPAMGPTVPPAVRADLVALRDFLKRLSAAL